MSRVIISEEYSSTCADLPPVPAASSPTSLLRALRRSMFGADAAVPTPLGPRRLLYCDHTASGRASSLIEDAVRGVVLPMYANTHTTTSFTGWCSHNFYEEARGMVRDGVAGASAADHAVVFTGRGATAASNALRHLLAPWTSGGEVGGGDGGGGGGARCAFPGCGRAFADAAAAVAHARTHPDGERTALCGSPGGVAVPDGSGGDGGGGAVEVVVGPFAHHSLFLPWAGAPGVTVRHVPWRASGCQLPALSAVLAAAAATRPRLLVALLTGASNVTGERLPAAPACALVHAFGGVAVWDAAAAAPHEALVMDDGGTMSAGELAALLGREALPAGGAPPPLPLLLPTRKDALLFSPHKFPGGGGGALGVLLVRRTLIRAATPTAPGGGTVFFVHPAGTARYSSDDSAREEGGSPDVAGAARAGLVLSLCRAVGWATIRARESAMAAAAARAWGAHPRLLLLGAARARGRSAPILSFLVRSARSGGALHWGLVCALLNDVWGVQARGGCLCSGVHTAELLGIDASRGAALERALLAGDELLRPGVTRVSFSAASAHGDFKAVVAAVLWVAEHGETLLPWYAPVRDSGEWRPVRAALRGAAHAGGGEAHARRVERYLEHFGGGGGGALGAGELEDAARGAARPHPRRWLGSVRFGEGGAPLRLPPPPPAFAWPAGDAPRRAAEAEVGDAVARVAAALAEGAALTPPPPGAAAAHAVDALLSPAGAPLRWFPLADAAPPPWSIADAAEAVAAAGAAAASAADGAGGEPHNNPKDATVAEYTRILECDDNGCRGVLLWDGEEEAGEDSGDGGGGDISACPVSAVSAARRGGAAPLAVVPPPPSAPAARPRPRTSAAAAFSLRCGDGGAPAAPAPLPAPLSPAQFSARNARLAATRAALARVCASPGPPAPLCRTLSHGIRAAVLHYSMIRPGDRVLVGLSGGKDSMTLLLQLLRLQAVAPVWFEVGAVTVDPQFPGFNPAPLAGWCAALGVPHFFEALPVLQLAEAHMDADSLCAFCARLKRGLLYAAARREGYNVLALGQHLDDLAESFLMSAFRNGVLRTMKAHYVNDEGDVRVIRPLALLREGDTRAYAAACALPVIPDTCPACFSGPTARYSAKRLLAREEAAHPTLFANLREALRPLMTSEGHGAVLAAASARPGADVLSAAPAGWAPAALGGEGGAPPPTPAGGRAGSPPPLGDFCGGDV